MYTNFLLLQTKPIFINRTYLEYTLSDSILSIINQYLYVCDERVSEGLCIYDDINIFTVIEDNKHIIAR